MWPHPCWVHTGQHWHRCLRRHTAQIMRGFERRGLECGRWGGWSDRSRVHHPPWQRIPSHLNHKPWFSCLTKTSLPTPIQSKCFYVELRDMLSAAHLRAILFIRRSLSKYITGKHNKVQQLSNCLGEIRNHGCGVQGLLRVQSLFLWLRKITHTRRQAEMTLASLAGQTWKCLADGYPAQGAGFMCSDRRTQTRQGVCIELRGLRMPLQLREFRHHFQCHALCCCFTPGWFHGVIQAWSEHRVWTATHAKHNKQPLTQSINESVKSVKCPDAHTNLHTRTRLTIRCPASGVSVAFGWQP